MNKKILLLLTSMLVSLPFWIGINLLQKSGAKHLTQNNQADIFAAQILPSIVPEQTVPTNFELATTTEDTCAISKITAESFLILKISQGKPNQILLEKNANNKLPLASITKLMTYLVASEFYKNDQDVIIPQEIKNQTNGLGILKPGDIFKVKELISLMLVESSNDAAMALSKIIGQDGFLDLMNFKAKELGLSNTYFYNPTGIDPEASGSQQDQINYSTAFDIALLSKYLIFSQPDFLTIVSQKKYSLYKNGELAWVLQNTNELLGEAPGVIGGKTGTTDRAGECLMVVVQDKIPNSYLIGVVLNSKQRFVDMKNLLTCVE